MTDPGHANPRRPLAAPLRYLLMAFAALCVALGVIGIFVPGLPTTVFILMAGWAAARSSPRFSAWLESHRLFGPMLKNWRETRSVSRRAKWSATVMMAFCAVILFLTTSKPWLAEAITAVMALVLAWLWHRPEPMPAPREST
ncbi:YbaN family protein [Solimonas sp. SE-A11]|uniref:YbaN family protein n=1 Tax=Solimonas sp. SE-A11 TaxID=3054954 RepID=UPI00259CC322|nr:YbaN family protein [Solimonas sp. SE-A11]MDM4771083.1 YbaN family protein [Solimonas sp. SE-A11]